MNRLLSALASLLLFALVACVEPQAATTSTPTKTATAIAADTQLPTSSPIPNAIATQDAARLKMTVQAFQTETSAVKGTARAEQSTQVPEILPITDATANDLTLIKSINVGEVYGATFSRNGTRSVILTSDKVLVVNLTTSEVLATLADDAYGRIAFPNQGEGFAYGERNGSLHINPNNETQISIENAHADSILEIQYSPDDRTVLTSSLDNIIRGWDSATGALKLEINIADSIGTSSPADRISFSPDGNIAYLFFSNDSLLWIGSTDQLLLGSPDGKIITWTEHAGPVADVKISPDGEFLAWTSRGTLQLMTGDGELINDRIRHQDWILVSLFAPNLNSFIVATTDFSDGEERGILRGYDLETGESKFELSALGMVRFLDTAPEQHRIITAHFDNNIRIWNSQELTALPSTIQHQGSILSVDLSADGRIGASIDETGSMFIWSVENGLLLQEFDLDADDFYALKFSADGTLLTTAAESGLVQVFGIMP